MAFRLRTSLIRTQLPIVAHAQLARTGSSRTKHDPVHPRRLSRLNLRTRRRSNRNRVLLSHPSLRPYPRRKTHLPTPTMPPATRRPARRASRAKCLISLRQRPKLLKTLSSLPRLDLPDLSTRLRALAIRNPPIIPSTTLRRRDHLDRNKSKARTRAMPTWPDLPLPADTLPHQPHTLRRVTLH